MKYFQGKINILNGQLLEGKNKNYLNEKKNSGSTECKNTAPMNKGRVLNKFHTFENNKMKNKDE